MGATDLSVPEESVRAAEADDRVFDFCRSPQDFLMELALAEGPVAKFRINDESFAVVSSPELVHAVMAGSMDDFEKGPLYAVPRTTFGDGVFTADGQAWSDQQAVLAPYFSRRRIGQLADTIGDLIDRQLDRWAGLPDGATIDMLAETKHLAFDVVGSGLLGISNPALSEELRDVLGQIDRFEAIRLYYLAKRIPSIGGTVQKTPLFDRLDRVLYAIVDQRLASPDEADDLIGATIHAPWFRELAPDKQRKVVRDLIASMMTAGYVSTGEGMFWTLYLLARHPEIQGRARAEILSSLEATEAGGASAGPGHQPSFASLRYLTAVVNESLRLYPPAWFIGRTAKRALQLGSAYIPAGTRLVCSPFILHRMPTVWPDPEAFRPERFLPGAALVPRAYIPYGAGSRVCLGRSLAAMEMSALIGAILSRFDVQLVSPEPVALAAAFTIHPRERVLFRLPRA